MKPVYIKLACVIIVLAGCSKREVSGNFASICSSGMASAQEVIKYCSQSINAGGLLPDETARAYLNRAVAKAELGKHEAAIRDFDLAEAADADLASIYLFRGRSHVSLGNIKVALSDYDKAAGKMPDSEEVYLSRGNAYLALGAAQEAIDDFNRGLQITPTNTDFLYNRAVAYLRLQMFDEVEKDLAALLAANAEDAQAYALRARARATSDTESALSDYAKALSFAPEASDIWIGRGRLYEQLGEFGKAEADYMRAYELGVRDAWLDEKLATIRNREKPADE